MTLAICAGAALAAEPVATRVDPEEKNVEAAKQPLER
jgi:hypothetical protein